MIYKHKDRPKWLVRIVSDGFKNEPVKFIDLKTNETKVLSQKLFKEWFEIALFEHECENCGLIVRGPSDVSLFCGICKQKLTVNVEY